MQREMGALLDVAVCAYGRVLHRLEGMPGVCRLLARTPKRSVIPLLRAFGAQVGSDADLELFLVAHNADPDFRNLRVGTGVHIGKQVLLDLRAPIIIEDRSTISMRAMLLTHLDVGQSPLIEQYPRTQAAVRVGAGAYLGAGAIVLPGVTIGERAVVAAGAVVTRDVPANTVVAGIPAAPMQGKPAAVSA